MRLMRLLSKWKRSALEKLGPRLSDQKPVEGDAGCDIVHEGESPLKAEYVLLSYYGSISTNN